MANAAMTSGAAVETTTEQRWPGFFSASLAEVDPEIAAAVEAELGREQHEIELIASENIVSRAVLEAQGSVLTNKYAEGYPGKRYYGGCEHVDVAEQLAIERAKRLFDCGFANVQPHSGAQANGAVMLALVAAGRHHPRHVARRRRPPHPRRQAGHVGQVVQRGPVWRAQGGRADRLSTQVERLARRAQAQADHRRRLGLFALHRLRALPGRSPTRSAPSSWSTWRTSPGWSRPACIPSPAAARACRDHDDAQDAARAARRHDPHQRRGARARRSTRPCSRACRAGR